MSEIGQILFARRGSECYDENHGIFPRYSSLSVPIWPAHAAGGGDAGGGGVVGVFGRLAVVEVTSRADANQVWDRLAANPLYRIWWNKTDGEPSEQYYLVPNQWPNAVYFVSSVKSKSDGTWLRHQVYRLSSNSSEEAFRDSIGSLVRFLNRGQTGDPGFPYEVIYSDPPEKSDRKR
jgi:hypothetical protein